LISPAFPFGYSGTGFEEVVLLLLDLNQVRAGVFCAAANVSDGSTIERKTSDFGRQLLRFCSSVCAETEPGIVCGM
jgi:hypothetical protein